jgi:hypothetical protein
MCFIKENKKITKTLNINYCCLSRDKQHCYFQQYSRFVEMYMKRSWLVLTRILSYCKSFKCSLEMYISHPFLLRLMRGLQFEVKLQLFLLCPILVILIRLLFHGKSFFVIWDGGKAPLIRNVTKHLLSLLEFIRYNQSSRIKTSMMKLLLTHS